LVADLLALGPSTGTAIVASTTSVVCAEELAGHAGQLVACGPASRELAARLMSAHAPADGGHGLDGDALTRQRPGELTVVGADYVRPGCTVVPIRAVGGSARVRPAGALHRTDVPAAAGSR
jgi:hypothetical protein